MISSNNPQLFQNNACISSSVNNSEWGTFKDCLKAPVHRWFTYPAGFSYKAVLHSIDKHSISKGQVIYDPFMGSGTTNIVAKTLGINSIGVEAHEFVYKIALAKMNWDINNSNVYEFINHVKSNLYSNSKILQLKKLDSEFPELVIKCFTKEALYDLWALREIIFAYKMPPEISGFFFVVITALLRNVSIASTGWPYIAPKKKKTTSFYKDVLTEFCALSLKMLNDLDEINKLSVINYELMNHDIYNSDSRNTKSFIQDNSVNHVFTSPPYLNNFDYADRTRLEMYFWGDAKTWGDISSKVRSRLITSATTQINRNDNKYNIIESLFLESPKIANFIEQSANELSKIRLTKGGKKSYDLLIIGYFNDMYLTIKDVFRVLKPNSFALFVLGDSAPYGVHIPTDTIIGELGLSAGFTNYDIEVLRSRGGKWKKNPQRHSIKLRESIVKFWKD